MSLFINGQLVDQAANGLGAFQIEAFEGSLSLTNTLTDGEGNFQLSLGTLNGTPIHFKVVLAGEVLYMTDEYSLSTLKASDFFLEITIPIQKVVKGQIAESDGTGISGYIVKAYDKGFCDETEIGDTVTDNAGYYEIEYTNFPLSHEGKTMADLFVRVWDGVNPDQVIQSPLFISAKPALSINLCVGESKYRGIPQIEIVANKIEEEIPSGFSCNGLSNSDLSYLENKHQLDKKTLAHYLFAVQLETEAGIDKTIAFALFQKKMALDVGQLLRQSSEAMVTAVQEAMNENIIDPAYNGGNVAQQIQAFRNQLASLALQPGETGESNTPVQEMMILAGLDTAEMSLAVEKQLEGSSVGYDFWDDLEAAGMSEAKVTALRHVSELSLLSFNNISLVRKLTEIGISQGAQLMQSTKALWLDVLADDKVDIPTWVTGDTPEEQRENYANALLERTEKTYPTGLFALKFIADSTPDSDFERFYNLALGNGFDLETTSISKFIQEYPATVATVTDAEALKNEVKSIQRIFRLAPEVNKYETFLALTAEGMDSAYAISKMGEGAFVAKFKDALGGEAEASGVHARASHAAAMALTVWSRYFRTSADTPEAIRYGTLTPGEIDPADEIFTEIPDLSTLFGSLDYCNCEHCRSVYSPAAYLVDLLEFLKEIHVSNATDPVPYTGPVKNMTNHLLTDRRPDIGTLLLNCENSNTPLPHIDLVNEILEHNVEPYPDFSLQTTLEAPALLAMPENINTAAYDKLKQAVYPWSAPFDLWLEEKRTWLRHMGIDSWEMMRRLPASGGGITNEIDLAGESLGLPLLQRAIITGDTVLIDAITGATPALEDFYGLTSSGDLINLKGISLFLKQSGLPYEELLQYLQSRFINPLEKGIVFTDNSCDLETAIFDFGTSPEDEGLFFELLERFHRFSRLQKAIGWEVSHLDIAILTLGEGNLNDGTLISIACADRLLNNLEISPEALLSWWNLPNRTQYEGASFYESLFLNPAVNNPLEDAINYFGLTADLSEIAATPTHSIFDESITPFILASTNLSHQDLRVISEKEFPSGDLTLENLSTLFRIGSFTDTLGVTVEIYYQWVSLIGKTPLGKDIAESDPCITEKFIQDVQFLQENGYSSEGLRYLLHHDFDPTSDFAQFQKTAIPKIESLREGLLEIQNGLSVDDLPLHEIVARILGVIFSEAVAKEALLIITGDSVLSELEQETFINDYFSLFLDTAGVSDAQSNLLGTGSLSDLDERYSSLVSALKDYLTDTHIPNLWEAYVIQWYVEELQLDYPIVNLMLKTHVLVPGSSSQLALEALLSSDDFINNAATLEPATYSAVFNSHELLYKISSLFHQLSVDEGDLDLLFSTTSTTAWPEVNGLPISSFGAPIGFDSWRMMVRDFTVQQLYFSDDARLTEILTLEVAVPSTALTVFTEALATATGWDQETLEQLAGPTGFNVTSFENGEWIWQISQALTHLNALGVSASLATSWNTLSPTFDIARAILNTAKSRHSNENWLKIAPEIRDVLRERQRNALRDYLIATDDRYEDVIDLYNWLLIDPEMSACGLTSRIKQANASIQLFVQRVLMNLEAANLTILTDEGKNALQNEWKWRKNYRVWEANRKVFLYPENWILPELRDDKSSFFEELENELLQDDVNDETVKRAYLNYLEKLDSVAFLEIAQMYIEEATEYGETDIVHVFARTKGEPNTYYYRRYEEDAYWTPWEEVKLKIEGDHLIPIKYRDRMILAWPLIKPAAKKPTDAELSGSAASHQPKGYFEVTLQWSEYKDGKWTPQRSSKKSLISHDPTDIRFVVDETIVEDKKSIGSGKKPIYTNKGYYPLKAEDIGFLGEVEEETGAMAIYPNITFSNGTPSKTSFVSQTPFFFSGCNVDPVVNRPRRHPSIFLNPYYLDRVRENMKLKKEDETGLFIKAGGRTSDSFADFPLPNEYVGSIEDAPKIDLLNKTQEGTNSLSVPHQYWYHNTEKPFFFEDEDRSFFIHKKPFAISLLELSPNAIVELTSAGFAGLSSLPVEIQNAIADWIPNPDEYGLDEGFYYSASDENVILNNDGSIELSSSNSAAFNAFFDPLVIWQEKWKFDTFQHPYVCKFVSALNTLGIEGLLAPSTTDELSIQQVNNDYFDSTYLPTENVHPLYPKDEIDFSFSGSYSLYNWELFFHAPFLIACRLSDNQKFEQAMAWFHYIFNPTQIEGDVPERFWRTKPFNQYNGTHSTVDLMSMINEGYPEAENQVTQWRKNPFNTHLLARMRTSPYMKNVVMKYLDNLLAWADQLFSRDTMESTGEAAQLYVLAAEILGKKPQKVDKGELITPEDYNSLEPYLDDFSNALIELESILPGSSISTPVSGSSSVSSLVNHLLYFCIPDNDKILEYWETVADRLFKIRHCQNIDGVFRQLSLFEPPIDPAILVQAAASGVDIGDAIAGINLSLPHYRFQYLYQKSVELCNDLKSLGGALLSALEKKDAEELALLRAGHEVRLLDAVEEVRGKAIEEAVESKRALQLSREITVLREQYYGSREYMIGRETKAMTKLEKAIIIESVGQGLMSLGGILAAIPNNSTGVAGIFSSPFSTVEFGGSNLYNAFNAGSTALSMIASIERFGANKALTLAGYDRRRDDWKFQADTATAEIEQIDQQLLAADIRIQMATKELKNHQIQMQNSQEVSDFMEYKYTNKELYSWMISQLSPLYFQAYKMAHGMAKKAEKAYQFERNEPEHSFIQYGYWDSLKKGLLAGENLHHDLKKMDISWTENNKREYELTKTISLSMLDPRELLRLQETGICDFDIPEILFDIDHPGHYMRRIKSVSLTIPCVTGPYTNVGARLSMVKSRIRKNTQMHDSSGKYGYEDINDDRFQHNLVGIQSIATSNGRNDSGLFELNFNDSRYLPFEGAGVISSWRIELPNTQGMDSSIHELRPFDYHTISDVLLTVSFMAREGGSTLRKKSLEHVSENLNSLIDELDAAGEGLYKLFSMKHQFPTELHQFLHPASSIHEAELEISMRHFPQIFANQALTTEKVYLIPIPKEGTVADFSGDFFELTYTPNDAATVENLTSTVGPDFSDLRAAAFQTAAPVEVEGKWKLSANFSASILPEELLTTALDEIDPDKVEDVLILINYRK